jgi:hypothetical protein
MEPDMTYEQTIELERNIKVKNKAREIVAGFKKNISLDLTKKNGLRFTIWSDSYNAEYVEVSDNRILFICDFLHEQYSVSVDESTVFSDILSKYRGIDHLAARAGVEYNPNIYSK